MTVTIPPPLCHHVVPVLHHNDRLDIQHAHSLLRTASSTILFFEGLAVLEEGTALALRAVPFVTPTTRRGHRTGRSFPLNKW